jgi:chromosomal replication initiator protein
LERGELTILTENLPQLNYLTDHCIRPFVEAAQAATGRLVSVTFATRHGETADSAERSSRIDGVAYDFGWSPARLNGDYVFDNFVVGLCNRLAHASCLAVSDSPGTAYNPLFLHGSAGLGKTHLLHAICHRLLDHSPEIRLAYVTSETFVNEYIDAVERNAVEGFRFRFRQLDVLLIDDVQFLAGKDRTQEEFFHTFNSLYQAQKQIVLTSDCAPSELPGLEERLSSRFKWGLVARIDPPCLETRLAIIRKKTRLRGMVLPEDAAALIASRVKSNTRELEGALNRLHGVSQVEGRQVDLAMVESSLSEQAPGPPNPIKLQDIMTAVTDYFNVRISDMQGRRRSRSIALPRQVGMYLARQFTGHSLEEIGKFFGNRDHTTVLHANRSICGRRDQDSNFRQYLEEIEDALRRM